ncbi:thiosulfate oxidation carrier protein SoxY [Ottowia sp.]|uniref:thiosulfate oxidation carrier protein SoxY n=1 Tax=Ottowia sp. TaxID=1898956 RepID=UPI003A8BA3B9
MLTRRNTLQQGAAVASAFAAGALWPLQAQAAGQTAALAAEKAAFAAKTVADAVKALGATRAMTASEQVTLTAPDISDNGSVVPVEVASTAANLKKIALVVEKNPAPLVAVFHVTPEVEASFATRSKMSQSSDVYAIALTSDGAALYAKKEVKVTLGGCGS